MSSLNFKPHLKKTAIYINTLGGECFSVQQSVPGKKDKRLETSVAAASKAFWETYNGFVKEVQ